MHQLIILGACDWASCVSVCTIFKGSVFNHCVDSLKSIQVEACPKQRPDHRMCMEQKQPLVHSNREGFG